MLPAASTAFASTRWEPSAKATGIARVNFLSAPANVSETREPSMNNRTRLLASAVPVTTGMVSLVRPSLELAPVSLLKPAITGASGARVSIRKVKTGPAVAELPAASVAVANTEWEPSASLPTSPKDQVPSATASVVPACLPSSVTTTREPASAWPSSTGKLLAVMLSESDNPVSVETASTRACAGASVSSTKLPFMAWEIFPARSA